MTFDEIVSTRHSVREFSDRPVSHEAIEAMCEAARWAPSAVNSQTWRFIVVRDRARIERLVKQGMGPVIGNKWMLKAPVVIAGCSQLDLIANRLGSSVTGIDYYPIDLGISMEHMVLKATELGLGTCWVGWINEEKVKEILEVPKRVRVMALLAVGYPAKQEAPKRTRLKLGEIVFSEKWQGPFHTERSE